MGKSDEKLDEYRTKLKQENKCYAILLKNRAENFFFKRRFHRKRRKKILVFEKYVNRGTKVKSEV